MAVTVNDVRAFKSSGTRFAMVTSYTAVDVRLAEEAGIPLVLVGDSVGNVLLGHPNTLPVDLEDMLHHCAAVARGTRGDAMLIGDMPFGSYHSSISQCIESAVEFLKVGMHAVKLEGARPDLVEALVESGIPVMGHLGLTPQHINAFGGHRIQGRGEAGAQLVEDASELADAGAFALVLEGVPTAVGRAATEAVDIPTIGIGAGPGTDGQVLVMHDLLGLLPGKAPKFVKRYADLSTVAVEALTAFRQEVESGSYPDDAHSYES